MGVGWVEEGRQNLGELSQPGPAWDGRASLRTSLQNKTLLASVCYPETDFHAGLSNHDLQKKRRETKVKSTEFAANSLDFPFRLPSTSPSGQGLPHPGPKINRICCKFVGFAFSPPCLLLKDVRVGKK